MTREELDKAISNIRSWVEHRSAVVNLYDITALLDHIARLERERDDYLNRAATLTKMWDKKVDEFNALQKQADAIQKQADAGRELRDAVELFTCDLTADDVPPALGQAIKAYDAAVKESVT